jgi:hypothetical protein
MIVFLNLKNQICEESNDFAFYDTVTNLIIEFDGCQVFDSLEDFKDSFLNSKTHNETNISFDRFISLIPEHYFN